jgi:hypothetical protein
MVYETRASLGTSSNIIMHYKLTQNRAILSLNQQLFGQACLNAVITRERVPCSQLGVLLTNHSAIILLSTQVAVVLKTFL